jgi:inhibitor of KinA sporulation pathway (predicted exonuclease)
VFIAIAGLPMPVGMARALQLAAHLLEGRHHRGDDDAWNIAALVLHLAERGDWPGTSATIVRNTTSWGRIHP